MNEIINDSTYFDVVCFGSSRALAHFNPIIIEKETGLTAFNAGLNGGCFVDFNALLKVYLESHPPPKMLVVHIDDFTFETQTISELPRYLPYISNDILYDNLKPYDNTFIAVRYIKFLRLMYYNDLLKWIAIKSLFHIEAGEQYKMTNGYRVNNSRWLPGMDAVLPERLEQIRNTKLTDFNDKDGEKLFSELLEICNQNKIKIIFTSSPIIGGDKFEKYNHTCNKITKLATAYDVSFFWLHQEQWDPMKYYYDFSHMNSNGADRYSLALSEFILEHK